MPRNFPSTSALPPAALAKITPQVFSKHRAVSVDSRKSASLSGLCARASVDASYRVPSNVSHRPPPHLHTTKGEQKKFRRRKRLTESRNNNNLRPGSNELAKRLRKRQIPTNQQPDLSDGRIEDRVRVRAGGNEVRPLGVPDVLFAVGAEDAAVGGDEVCRVVEGGGFLWRGGCIGSDDGVVGFDNGPRDDADV